MERWPTPADLAAASPSDVLRAWDRLGYPRRALRLQECARVVVDRYDGALPTTEAELLDLPGVGAYTAAAVTAFAYGRRSVVLDTNVRRVLARTLDGEALPPPHQSVAETRRADGVVPADDASAVRWNVAAMELGAVVCSARAPRCEVCPVERLCAWRAAGTPPDPHAARRRAQTWSGSDRQVRGLLMAALRSAEGPLTAAELAGVWPDEIQRVRALGALIIDGLVETADVTGGHTFQLPRSME